MYLLDTNLVGSWMSGDPVVIERLKAHSPSDLALSAITLAEICYGIENSSTKEKERWSRIEKIAKLLKIYHFDESAARSYAAVRTRLENDGIALSERDTQIAAIVLAHRLVLVTHNVKEFQRIAFLKVEDWAAD